MRQVFPDYYPRFQCSAGACKHSCCIGWEIDIDDHSAARYAAMEGPLGARLQRQIDWETDPPHFRLGDGQRCPFLNKDNLCDIILAQGEEGLCDICHLHPRFHNELPGRTESGLGLCCEAAGALILGQTSPARLLGAEDAPTDDHIIALRDRVIALLQDRALPLDARVSQMLRLCDTALPDLSIPEWCDCFLELERLDDAWTQVLEALKTHAFCADHAGFAAHMAARQTEYEQLLVYLIYRHMANAPDLCEAAARAAFAAVSYCLLQAAGAVQWTRTGCFTFADQVELARLFSAEIEYSDENLYQLLEYLY